MQTHAIVARLLRCCVPLMHAARWQVLCDVAVSAVCGRALTLTSLALGTARTTSVRHRVKCVDRLLANPHLESERIDAYCALAHEWLSDLPQLLIVVDWSSLTADLKWHWLRASVVVEGRSITLYEEVHARKDLAARAVHKQFIKRLAALLPATDSPPIILTDAGFRTPWFRMVADEGWNWVGRTRNRDFVRRPGGRWTAAKGLYVQATGKQKTWAYTKRCAIDRSFAALHSSRTNPRAGNTNTRAARRRTTPRRARLPSAIANRGCSVTRLTWPISAPRQSRNSMRSA